MTKIVFGCPMVDRAWVVRDWLAALGQQDVDYEVAVLLSPCQDETEEILRADPHVRIWKVLNKRDPRNIQDHAWYPLDVAAMAGWRNTLRSRVTSVFSFDYYCSLDSDVILPSHTLPLLVSHLEQYRDVGAVSPLVNMESDPEATRPQWNYMQWVGDGDIATRSTEHVVPSSARHVDVIMAAILMRPEVLEVSHWTGHAQGEDIAWAGSLRHYGWKLMIEPSIIAEHRMSTSRASTSS